MIARAQKLPAPFSSFMLLLVAGSLSAQAQVASAPQTVCIREAGAASGAYPEFVAEIAVAASGEVAFLDGSRRTIHEMDPSSGQVQTLDLDVLSGNARISASAMGYQDELLWVHDARRALTLWLRDLKVVRRLESPYLTWRDSLGTTMRASRPLEGGSSYLAGPVVLSPILAAGLAQRIPFMKVNPLGQIADTVLWVPVAAHDILVVEGFGDSSEKAYLTPLIGESHIVRVTPSGDFLLAIDRRVHGDKPSSSIVIHRIDLTGDTVAAITLEVPEQFLTQPYLTLLAEGVVGPGAPLHGKIEPSRYLDFVWKPDVLPPIRRAVIASAGAVWMQLHNVSNIQDAADRWLVLAPSFDHVKVATIPSGVQVRQIHGDTVWGISPAGRVERLSCRTEDKR